MAGGGACVAWVHAWQGACIAKEGACMVRGCAWQRGACIVKGVVYGIGGRHGKGGYAWQGHTWHGEGVMCGQEAYIAGEHTWLGCMRGQGACVAGETATAVDGTHPTGMHSC